MEFKSIYPSFKRKNGLLGFRFIISRNKRFSWKFLVMSLGCLCSLGYLVYTVPPSYRFSILNSQFSITLVFFPLLFLFLFSFFMFLFGNKKHAVLVSLFIVSSSALLANNLTQPFFFILLAALFFVLEML